MSSFETIYGILTVNPDQTLEFQQRQTDNQSSAPIKFGVPTKEDFPVLKDTIKTMMGFDIVLAFYLIIETRTQKMQIYTFADDKIIAKVEETYEHSNHGIFICSQSENYVISASSAFRISKEKITPINFEFYTSSNKRVEMSTLLGTQVGTQEPFITSPMEFEGRKYVLIQTLLFELITTDSLIAFHCVDEFINFNKSIFPVTGKGFGCLINNSNSSPFIRMTSSQNKPDHSFTYNPITHKLEKIDLETQNPVFCSIPIDDHKVAIVAEIEIYEEINEYSRLYRGKKMTPEKIINIDKINFTPVDYEFHALSLPDNKQYCPLHPECFTKGVFNGIFNIYIPKEPFKNYRVVEGFGSIPDEFKLENYKELSSLEEIKTQLGAPIFYAKKDFNNKIEVNCGAISISDNIIQQLETIVISLNEFSRTSLRNDDIIWIGILDTIYDSNLTSTKETCAPKWRVPVPIDTIDVADGEDLIAADPCDVFTQKSEQTHIKNCLGGKWIPSIQYQDDTVGALIFVHNDYQKILEEIPKKDLLEVLHQEGLTPGMRSENLPGWEFCGVVGSDVAMSLIVTDSHFFNPNDIDIDYQDPDEINKIGNFVIGDGSFRPHDKDTAVKTIISKIITDIECEEMFFVPGGAVCMSGYGDGCYPVFAKRVNGKVICAFTAFI